MAVSIIPSRIFPSLFADAIDEWSDFEGSLWSSRKRRRNQRIDYLDAKRPIPALRRLSSLSPYSEFSFRTLPKAISAFVDFLKPQVGKKNPLSIESVNEDDSNMEISFNVSGYKPEELAVNLDGRTLIAEGKQEIQKEGEYSMRFFKRQLELPDDIVADSIQSQLSEDGHQLSIHALKVPKRKQRRIPIEENILKRRKYS